MIFSKAAEKKTVKARSKPSEYEAMLRNGFILPKLNSTIVNKIYMYRVKSLLEYCPMTSDIKVYKICINPPSKDYLLNQIQEELAKKGDVRDLTYDEKHLPDVEWCVKALLALNPEHHIFDKDYVPNAFEKGRKGAKIDQSFQEEEEVKRFDEFDQGLPYYLHQPQKNLKSNPRFTGRPYKPKKEAAKLNDDTLTDKDFLDENMNFANQQDNKMEIQEPPNPFQKQSFGKNGIIQTPSHQINSSSRTEISGHSQLSVPLQPQSQLASKNLDLQSTIKQLNSQLFPSNISKNKSKKKLSDQEEELIVSMFEKLVVNCKGRPVDFVKSYLDQYHSEKKPLAVSSTSEKQFQGLDPKRLQAPFSEQKVSQNPFQNQNFGTSFNYFSKGSNQMSKIIKEQHENMHTNSLTSPSKYKGFHFNPSQQQAVQQFNLPENHDKVNQSDSEALPGEQIANSDINMVAQIGVPEENDDEQNFKEMLLAEYEGSSNFTTVFNGNSENVQSLSSFNPSNNPQQQIFNI